MKKLLTLLCICLFTAATAQNIVPNPSFALYDNCPDAGQSGYCKFWYSTTPGKGTYYNPCNNATPADTFGVPSNRMGFERSPNSYIGLNTYGSGVLRDYMITDIPALTPGVWYRVSIKISLADKSAYKTIPPQIFFYSNGNYIDNIIYRAPHIDYTFHELGGREDTTWVVLSDHFTADSAYTHLMIGTFKLEGLLHAGTHDATQPFARAHYYIDSISVQEDTPPTHLATLPTTLHATVQPNPFTTETRITFPNPNRAKHSLSIHNMLGALIRHTDNIDTPYLTISRDLLPAGTYYYTLSRADGASQRGMFIIN